MFDVFDLSQSKEFDEGIFQAYLTIGRNMVSNLRENGPQALARPLEDGLDTFNEVWKLSSGQSMELLWNDFRLPTANSVQHLELKIRAERLTDEFDTIEWPPDISLQDLSNIRQSVAQVYSCTRAESLTSPSSFQVNYSHIVSKGRIDSEQDLTKAVSDLRSESSSTLGSTIPYMRAEFEALRQCEAALLVEGFGHNDTILSLLAREPTKFSMQYGSSSSDWQEFLKIGSFMGNGKPESALAFLRGTFTVSILQKL